LFKPALQSTHGGLIDLSREIQKTHNIFNMIYHLYCKELNPTLVSGFALEAPKLRSLRTGPRASIRANRHQLYNLFFIGFSLLFFIGSSLYIEACSDSIISI